MTAVLHFWLMRNIFIDSTHVLVFLTEYCMDHWKEDWFFGYQCLNGSNPRMIRRCQKLPENFPVTPDMVQRSMDPKTNLDKELKVDTYFSSAHFSTFCVCKQPYDSPYQAGNIYILDYAIIDGVPSNIIRGQTQYIAAPLCLLYQHPDGKLIPIAIQVCHYRQFHLLFYCSI